MSSRPCQPMLTESARRDVATEDLPAPDAGHPGPPHLLRGRSLLRGLEQPERNSRRVGEDRQPPDVRDVHRLEGDLRSELLRLRRVGVDIGAQDVHHPARRHGLHAGLLRHPPGPLLVARVEDRVGLPLAHVHVGRGPAEHLGVEALRRLDVVDEQLVPAEHALRRGRVARRRVRRDDRALRVADDGEPAPLGSVRRLDDQRSAGGLGSRGRVVDVLHQDVADPVRGVALGRRPEAAVLLAVGDDHRVVGPARLHGLGLPAEQSGGELRRLLRLARSVVVPDEGSDGGLHRRTHTRLLTMAYRSTLATEGRRRRSQATGSGAGTAAGLRRSATAAKKTAPASCPAATRSPAGPARSANVSTAVITFARTASGVRVVRRPISGAFTSGPNSEETKSTATTPTTGSGRASTPIGSVSATSEIAPRRIGSNRGTTRIAATLPTTAPAPKAAKKTPATRELPPKDWYASTGSDADSIWPNMFTTSDVTPIARS